MLLLKPLTGATVMVNTAVSPCTTETPVALGVIVKSAPDVTTDEPVPVIFTFAGEFAELPLTVRVADSELPVVLGVNVRLMVQLAEVTSVNGGVAQVVAEMAKSVLPESATPVTVSGKAALFESVTTCALL
jgi:hypothetical protein